MAIYKIFQEAVFGLEDIARMSNAYEMVLAKLQLAKRDDPITQVIAAKVIELFRAGEHDPAILCQKVVSDLEAQPRKA